MGRLYVLVPVFGAAGFLLWSASRLVREIRHEVV
jgi:hypothetical protein